MASRTAKTEQLAEQSPPLTGSSPPGGPSTAKPPCSMPRRPTTDRVLEDRDMNPEVSSHQAPEPFEAAMEGWSSLDADDWPNTVTVRAVDGWEPAADGTYPLAHEREQDGDYADQAGGRHLVEVDTNYKATRPGQHPVRLTRADAVHLAARIVDATEDTFHYMRCGRLRAAEAAAVLNALNDLDCAIAELRDHALQDLLTDTVAEGGEKQ